MGKINRFVTIFLFLIIAAFANFEDEFSSIQNEMKNSPSKAYTDLQSLYLHLILHGSDEQKIKVLNALIETSKMLQLNYDRYEKALNELQPKQTQALASKQASTQKSKTSNATIKNISLEENRVILQFSKPTNAFRSFTLQGETIRYVFDFYAVLPQVNKNFKYGDITIRASQFDSNIVRVVIRSKDEIFIQTSQEDNQFIMNLPLQSQKLKFDKDTTPSKVVATSLKDGKLQISFNKQTPYKHFILRQDKIRYVYDFQAVFPKVNKTYRYANSTIRISQFNPSTVRVVVATDKETDLNLTVEGSDFLIRFELDETALATTEQPQRKFRVVIDPGHGGKDPGAVGYRGFREKVIALNFSLAVKKYLEQSGIEVFLTRDDDRYLTLNERTKFANNKKADVFISIHANAAENKNLHGIETYFLSPARSERAKQVAAIENKEVLDQMAEWSSKNTFLSLINREKIIESNKLAIDIQKNMLFNVTQKYKDVRDGGVREAPFCALIGAQMPAVLIELGYITNKTEAQRLVLNRYKDYQDLLAKGIAEGIINYLSIAKRF